MDGLVTGVIHDEEERIADLRAAMRVLSGLHKKRIEPFHIYLDLAERLLWNWALDQLDAALADLEGKIADLERAAHDCAEIVERVLACLGNPATLQDVATLLREGVAALCTELAPQVNLVDLSVDNAWDSAAAERYTERAQLQGTEGLEELARRANSLADSLDGHSAAELNFWDGVAGLIVEVVVLLAGVFFTLLGLIATVAGLALAAPTGGASIVIAALGLISCIGGLVVTAVSGFLIAKSFIDLINDAEASLASTVDEMTSNALPEGQRWPILAT